MNPISLNLPAPPKAPSVIRDERCPTCKAGKDQRVQVGGFGPHRSTLCGACGYEFKETA